MKKTEFSYNSGHNCPEIAQSCKTCKLGMNRQKNHALKKSKKKMNRRTMTENFKKQNMRRRELARARKSKMNLTNSPKRNLKFRKLFTEELPIQTPQVSLI